MNHTPSPGQSTVPMPVMPIGTSVWIAWRSKGELKSDTGAIAAYWACGVCHFDFEEANGVKSEIDDLERLGLSCDNIWIYRVHTDRGSDVMVHLLDPKVLVVPVSAGARP